MHIAVFLPSRSEHWRFQPRHEAMLRAAFSRADVTLCEDEAGFLEALPRATVALVWRFDPAWLERAGALTWIATPAAGHEGVPVESTDALTVTHGRFHGELMGETVLGMMLALTRGLAASMRLMAEDPWPTAAVGASMRPLRGRHLVILGFGRIGRWIGRLAKPFGMRVTGIKRTPVDPPAWFAPEDRVRTADHLDAVLPEADHLALALPGTTGTDCILDARRIGLLPEGAFVYNVGRGNAIDEAALAAALADGRLGGAGLDVFEKEPLPADAPIRACPRAILMPHASALSPNYLDLFVQEFIERYRDTMEG
jgi:phosphoglycerate dehydrogenase-like enzyme